MELGIWKFTLEDIFHKPFGNRKNIDSQNLNLNAHFDMKWDSQNLNLNYNMK